MPIRGPAKGNHSSFSGRLPFSRLIYPVPEKGGLGIYLAADLSGRARFGPDVEWVLDYDYSANYELKKKFASAIRKYWPAVKQDKLTSDYSGIRPKIEKNDINDF